MFRRSETTHVVEFFCNYVPLQHIYIYIECYFKVSKKPQWVGDYALIAISGLSEINRNSNSELTQINRSGRINSATLDGWTKRDSSVYNLYVYAIACWYPEVYNVAFLTFASR